MKTTTFLILLATSLSIRNQIAADGGEYGAASSQLSLGEVTRLVLENNPAIKEAENRWQAASERDATSERMGRSSRCWRIARAPLCRYPAECVHGSNARHRATDPRHRQKSGAGTCCRQPKRYRSFEEARRIQLDVIAKARATYFQLANAYDQLEINSKNLTSLKQIADISRSRYETGLESAANVLIAETDYSKLQEARRDLERNLSDAQSQLNTLMNRDAFAPLGPPVGSDYHWASFH